MANLMFNAGLSQSDISQYERMKKDYSKTRFADILSANPYLTYNRQPTFWEKTLSALGFRTGYDKDIEQQANAFREYNAQVAQLSSEDQYNTPAAMAARMREGGLNPDLSGVSGVAPAGEFAAEQTSPNYSDGAQATFGALASTAMDVLTMTIGFAKDLGSLRVLQNQYESGDIANASSMMDAALKAARIGDSDNQDPYKADFLMDAYGDTFFKSRRNRRSFKQAFTTAVFSLQNKAQHYSDARSVSDNKTANARNRASLYWSEASDDDLNNAMSALMRPIVQAEEDVYQKRLKNAEKETRLEDVSLENQIAYQENLDPAQQAKTETQANLAIEQQNRQDKDLNSVMARIIHNLSEESKKGNNWASIALLLFSLLRDRVQLPVKMDFGKKEFTKNVLPGVE